MRTLDEAVRARLGRDKKLRPAPGGPGLGEPVLFDGETLLLCGKGEPTQEALEAYFSEPDQGQALFVAQELARLLLLQPAGDKKQAFLDLASRLELEDPYWVIALIGLLEAVRARQARRAARPQSCVHSAESSTWSRKDAGPEPQ